MDKYDLVLDIVEHPEKYTSEQLAEILSELETREIYNLLCKTDSAIEAEKYIDVDAEWVNFAEKHSVRSRHNFFWFGSRAATIAAIVCTSIVTVATIIGVSVVIDYKPKPIADINIVAPTATNVSTDTLTVQSDTVKVCLTPIMFENEPLEKIMTEVAEAYGIEEVIFNNSEAATLHLYYKFDPSLPLNEVVEQLNTFEQINIKQNDNVLTID